MSINPQNSRNDLYRFVISMAVIIIAAILVGLGKVDISVFILIITGVTTYYLGKSSSKGGIID